MSVTILRGDARALPLADACVDLIVCSPPYYQQRVYQDAGGTMAGQIGLEATPCAYIAALLDATRDWMRVLKPGGSLWVNLGDTYSQRTAVRRSAHQDGLHPARDEVAKDWQGDRALGLARMPRENITDPGTGRYVPEKSLMGMPWRPRRRAALAVALTHGRRHGRPPRPRGEPLGGRPGCGPPDRGRRRHVALQGRVPPVAHYLRDREGDGLAADRRRTRDEPAVRGDLHRRQATRLRRHPVQHRQARQQADPQVQARLPVGRHPRLRLQLGQQRGHMSGLPAETARTPQSLDQPIAVYDAREDSWRQLTEEQRLQLLTWIAEQGIPLNIYRLEIHIIDCPMARVFAYERDEQGYVLINDQGFDARRRPPYDRAISSMPPALRGKPDEQGSR